MRDIIMELERVDLEIAKLLKVKGFNFPVKGVFTVDLTTIEHDNPSFKMTEGEITFDTDYIINGSHGDYSSKNYTQYARPTQSLACKWLRDIHNIQITPIPECTANEVLGYTALLGGWPLTNHPDLNPKFIGSTYEEAEAKAIKHILEKIIE